MQLGVCEYCAEEILPEEICNQPGYHLECVIRAVMGSAAHILGECSCYGGTRHDPPGVSPREAAKLAFEAYYLTSQK
jgi:hypothetical protein